jgi:hypothetical protein
MFASATMGAIAFGKAMKDASRAQGLFKALSSSVPELSTAIGIGLALIAEDLWNFYQGNESVAGKVSKTLEEFIGASIEFFGELFGIPKKDLDKMLIDIDNTFRTWLPKIWDFIVDDFNAFVKRWKEAFAFWTEDITSLGKTLSRFFGFVGGEGAPARNRSPLVGQAPAAFGGPSAPPPTGGVNNIGGARTSNVNVNSPITLNLPPGMSPEDVARQVKRELDIAAGWAVDSNSKGVVY